jgi:hypothetical protein
MKLSHLLVALALLMIATVATAQHQHAVPNVIHIDGRERSVAPTEVQRSQTDLRLLLHEAYKR